MLRNKIPFTYLLILFSCIGFSYAENLAIVAQKKHQLAILAKDNILEEASKELHLPNGQPATFSFINFPYNFGADEKRLKMQSEGLLTMPIEERREAYQFYI